MFLFGKRYVKKKSKSLVKIIPKIIKQLAKKFKIKLTIKRGSKRVYKKLSVIKKQILKAKKKLMAKKNLKRQRMSKFRFGEAPFVKQVKNFGFNQKVERSIAPLSQTSSVITKNNILYIPPGTGVKDKNIPIY